MTRRYISLLLIIGVMLCLFSCTLLRERVEGGISTEGLYVDMLASDLKAHIEENGSGKEYWACGHYRCFMDEWGDTVIVRLGYTPEKVEIVEDIVICDSQEPQERSYLEEQLKGSLTFEDVVKVVGRPIDKVEGHIHTYYVFPVAGGEKLYAEFKLMLTPPYTPPDTTYRWGLTDFYFE